MSENDVTSQTAVQGNGAADMSLPPPPAHPPTTGPDLTLPPPQRDQRRYQPAPRPAASPGFCRLCGVPLPHDAAFCPACGGRTVETAGAAAAAYPLPHGVPAPIRTNGYAVAGLVLGILWLGWLGSILALIFGYVAKRQIEASHRTQDGNGMAVAAIVLGWIGIAVLIVVIVLAVAGVATQPNR